MTARRLIDAYIRGGRIPWSTGYGEYRMAYIDSLLADASALDTFRRNAPLARGHGFRVDERAVEYPWVFARLSSTGTRVLDAGSTLNYPNMLRHPRLASHTVIICNLVHDYRAPNRNARYVTADLRLTPFPDEAFDVVVCISTLEHVGLETEVFGARMAAFGGADRALFELHRVLRPGARLLVTVPFGQPGIYKWFRQYDAAAVSELIDRFAPRSVESAYFRYLPEGWVLSSADECGSCEYFDIHATPRFDSDYAAAARAVVCLSLQK
jgi:SAM-dependent methyltransferase